MVKYAYDINSEWVSEYFNISKGKAEAAVEWLYESNFFHDHIIEDLSEALEALDTMEGGK